MGSSEDGEPRISIDAKAVRHIFLDCLTQKGEELRETASATCLGMTVEFDQDRLLAHRNDIEAMRRELPIDFYGAYGASISDGRRDRNRYDWTINLDDVKRLFLLLLATGKIKLVFPENVWNILPDGRPFYKTT